MVKLQEQGVSGSFWIASFLASTLQTLPLVHASAKVMGCAEQTAVLGEFQQARPRYEERQVR